MIAILTLLIFVICGEYVQAQTPTCASVQCDPCRDKALKIDFIFIIDASGSMQQEITSVANGLKTLQDEITAQSIDAKSWVVLVGGRPQLIIDGETSSTVLKSKFSQISATKSVPGLHVRSGGIEPSFEAIRMALKRAPYNKFDTQELKKWKPSTTGYVNLRSDAKKFVMLLTDEDSDKPQMPQNYAPYSYVSPWTGSNPTSWSYTNGPYAQELKDTISALAGDIYFYGFVGTTGSSKKQYGDPGCDSSNADFSGFDRTKTLDCMKKAGLGLSLGARLMEGGVTARIFNILDVNKPGVVDKFFQTTISDVSKCEMKRKRSIEPIESLDTIMGSLAKRMPSATPVDQSGCVSFYCDQTKYDGFIRYECLSHCNQCKIGGVCYRDGDQKPGADSCYFCDPSRSKTAWSFCSGYVDSPKNCNKRVCYASFGSCQVEQECEARCDACEILDESNRVTCQKSGWTKDDRLCVTCNPAVNDKDWTDVCPVCNPDCENGGVCTKGAAGAPDYCDCSDTIFVGDQCQSMPECTPACENSGVCTKELIWLQEQGNPNITGSGDPNAAVCACRDGWGGPTCADCVDEVFCRTCAPTCLNGGQCVDTKCQCDGTGYTGVACDQKIIPMCSPVCEHGECNTENECVCHPNYYGDACDHYAQPATPATRAACENRVGFVCAAVESFGEVNEHLVNCDEGAVSWEVCTSTQTCSEPARACNDKGPGQPPGPTPQELPDGVVSWQLDSTCREHCLELCPEEKIITCQCSVQDNTKWLECDYNAAAGLKLALASVMVALMFLIA